MRKQQVRFTAPGQVEIVETEVTAPQAGEVLVRNLITMISPGTERAFLLGLPNARRFPYTPGYSSAGEVVAVGAGVESVKPGALVAAMGRHESYAVLPAASVYPIPAGLTPERAVFLCLGAIALQGVRKARIELGESALVVGQGMIGVLAAQLCSLSGAVNVAALEKDRFRLDVARQCGLHTQVNPDEAGADLLPALLARNGGRGFEVVVEATGYPDAIRTALSAAGRMGRVVLLGSTRGESTVDFYQSVHLMGLQVLGAHNVIRPAADSTPGYWTLERDAACILHLLAAGRLVVDPLITHRADPDGIPALYRHLADWDPHLLGAHIHWSGH